MLFFFRLADSDKYIQPDAANFNSWRRHTKLLGDPPEEVTFAWEDVKAMFNGGTRKRMMANSSHDTMTSSCPTPALDKILAASNIPENKVEQPLPPPPPPPRKYRKTKVKDIDDSCNSGDNKKFEGARGTFPYFPSAAAAAASAPRPDMFMNHNNNEGPPPPNLFSSERLAFAAAVAAASNATAAGSFTAGLADYLWPLGQSPLGSGAAAAASHQLPMTGYPLFWPKKPMLGSTLTFGR